jgi:hypothetical protein
MERERRFFFLACLIDKSCWLSATLAFTVLALGVPPSARALDAKSFDFNLRPALGQRPLIAIWVRPPDETPATEIARRKQYYEDLFFGQPRHASAYPDQLRQLEPSVADFYRQASGGKFSWRRAGFVGPLAAPVTGKSEFDVSVFRDRRGTDHRPRRLAQDAGGLGRAAPRSDRDCRQGAACGATSAVEQRA